MCSSTRPVISGSFRAASCLQSETQKAKVKGLVRVGLRAAVKGEQYTVASAQLLSFDRTRSRPRPTLIMRPYKSSSKWYVTAIYTGLQELVLISYELRHAVMS